MKQLHLPKIHLQGIQEELSILNNLVLLFLVSKFLEILQAVRGIRSNLSIIEYSSEHISIILNISRSIMPSGRFPRCKHRPENVALVGVKT